ncbi:MAG: hypothetical protein J6A25_03230 [Lachnospiraceae bacterium]|nr:hypothetical protein [Lachnospiraceae bacterium]
MKKLFLILLSVMVLSLAGCNSTDVDNNEDSGYEEPKETVEQTDLVQADCEQDVDVEEQTSTEAVEEPTTVPSDSSNDDVAKESTEKEAQTPEQTTAPAEEPKEEQASKEPVENTPEPTPQPTPAPTPEPTPEPEPEVQTVGYSPDTVVALAIAKCQAGGMITTQDNLANALAEGRITQEEYNEYYPYDGLEGSYYSVFVETDLNIASKIDGTPLRSEDEIATYIANMLLLEQSPVFNIVYAGVYSSNGTDYYEFRCLR